MFRIPTFRRPPVAANPADEEAITEPGSLLLDETLGPDHCVADRSWPLYVMKSLNADGLVPERGPLRTIIYRHLFDLFEKLERIDLSAWGDADTATMRLAGNIAHVEISPDTHLPNVVALDTDGLAMNYQDAVIAAMTKVGLLLPSLVAHRQGAAVNAADVNLAMTSDLGRNVTRVLRGSVQDGASQARAAVEGRTNPSAVGHVTYFEKLYRGGGADGADALSVVAHHLLDQRARFSPATNGDSSADLLLRDISSLNTVENRQRRAWSIYDNIWSSIEKQNEWEFKKNPEAMTSGISLPDEIDGVTTYGMAMVEAARIGTPVSILLRRIFVGDEVDGAAFKIGPKERVEIADAVIHQSRLSASEPTPIRSFLTGDMEHLLSEARLDDVCRAFQSFETQMRCSDLDTVHDFMQVGARWLDELLTPSDPTSLRPLLLDAIRVAAYKTQLHEEAAALNGMVSCCQTASFTPGQVHDYIARRLIGMSDLPAFRALTTMPELSGVGAPDGRVRRARNLQTVSDLEHEAVRRVYVERLGLAGDVDVASSISRRSEDWAHTLRTKVRATVRH